MRTHVAASLVLALTPTARAQSFEATVLQGSEAPYRTYVATVDLDQDGDLDLLSCEGSARRVVWHENTGAGRFTGARAIGLVGGGDSAAATDFDGDGDLDVLVTNLAVQATDAVSVLENLGAGRFADAAPLSGGSPYGSLLSAVDLDGDGDQDLLLAALRENPVWRANLGGGAFGPPQPIGVSGVELGFLGAADIDGDGNQDVVWSKLLNGQTFWCRGLGGGAFATGQHLFAPGCYHAGTELVDLEGDGDVDIVVGCRSAGGVWIRPNLGGGTFGPLQSLLPPVTTPRQIAAADLDGDGDAELLSADSSAGRIDVFENTGNLTFAASGSLAVDGWSSVSNTMGTADLDGDGKLDLWAATGPIEVAQGDGAGHLAAPLRIGLEIDGAWTPAVGDVDSDGRPEIVSATSNPDGIVVIDAFGGPGAQVSTVLESGDTATRSIVVDLDGDGDDDVVLGGGSYDAARAYVGWYENDGGSLLPFVHLVDDFADSGAEVRAGDANGDGRVDLLMSYTGLFSNDQVVLWLVQSSSGSFVPASPTTASRLMPVDVADLDGDGLDDVVAQSWVFGGASHVSWLRTNTGSMLDAPTVIASFPLDNVARRVVTAGDIDANGLPDLLRLDTATGTVDLLRNQGGGTFAAPAPIAPAPAIAAELITLADVDSDGDEDVVLVGESGSSMIHVNDGAGSFQATLALESDAFAWSVLSYSVAALTALDVEGDGDLDLVTAATTGLLLDRNTLRFGRGYCLGEAVGSNGLRPRMYAEGSDVAAQNALTLGAEDLPPTQFGIFVVSDATDFVPLSGGIGTRCVGGAIGRFSQPGQILQASPAGTVALPIDLTAVPTPTGSESITAGMTRNFQYWTRDTLAMPTSNFSSALAITFR